MGINNTTAAAIIANNNTAKTATINAAIESGDLKALAIQIRPTGEFARVSCPSSMEFGDTDINYHGKRIAGLADAHEIDRDHIMEKVGRLSAKIRTTYGPALKELQAERMQLQAVATKHGDTVRRIDDVIAVLKEELSLRESDRAAYKAKVEAERVVREAAKVVIQPEAMKTVAVIQPEATVIPLPAKWLRPTPRVKKVAVKRDDIRVGSFEELAAILS